MVGQRESSLKTRRAKELGFERENKGQSSAWADLDVAYEGIIHF